MKNTKVAFKIVGYVLKQIPFYVISSIIVIIIEAISVWLDLYITEQVVFLIEGHNAGFYEVLRFIIIMVSISELLKIICHIQQGYVKIRSRHLWIKRIQYILFDKSRELSIKYFDDPALYDKFSRALNQDLKCINTFDSIITLLTRLGQIFVLIAYIAINVPILFIIVLVASIVTFTCYTVTNRKYHKLYKETEVNRRKQEYVKRTFYLEKYAMDIKTTNISSLLLEQQLQAYNEIERKTKKVDKICIRWFWLEDFIYQFVNCFVVYSYLMYKVFFGNLLISKFIPLSSATLRFNNSFYSVSHAIGRLNRDLRELEDLIWLINYEGKKQDNLDDALFNRSLELKNVSFKYPNEENFSLDNINIKIKKGEKIAIIGNNGAGKTTLTKLMLKLYMPDSGEILFDDTNYINFKDKSVTCLYSTVLQNFQIYCATIGENIIMKQVETEEEVKLIEDAIKKVELDKIIDDLPDGVNTILTKEFSQDGLELSGGQRQKIAIARVFASNAPIAILDEPTSALDPIAEKEINENIMALCEEQGKTLIIISHRLSTIVNVDCIYMMKNGKIVEQGTHQELIKNHGAYYEMFEAQAKLYKEEKNTFGDVK